MKRSRKQHLPGDILWDSDGGVGVYGHVGIEAVIAALRPRADEDWTPNVERMAKTLRHDWMRFTPAQPGDDYKMWAWPAKKGERGAFPVTEIWQ